MAEKVTQEEEEEEELGFSYWVAVRRRYDASSHFFFSGDVDRELLAKQIALDITEEEMQQIQDMEGRDKLSLFCPIVGCRSSLKSLEDFEDHYEARHSASCSMCSRVYPTGRLLNIHVAEAHDSFFQAKVARGYPMYDCLVEGCSGKFKTYKARHRHLVDKHKFPTSFEFLTKSHRSKKQRQRHQRLLAKERELQMPIVDNEEDEINMEIESKIDDLSAAVSKLSTADSPSNVSFGRRHARGIMYMPRSVQQLRKQAGDEDKTR